MPVTTTRQRMAERMQQVGSPVLFARHVSRRDPRPYLALPHVVAIDRAVRRAIREGGRLIITMPPRHGKSELVSKYLAAWYLGTFPGRRVVVASYEATFASTWGRAARDIMEAHGGLWGLRVRSDSRAVSAWDLAGHRGGMVTAGVGGALTGRGGDLIVVDDPVKNSAEAMSPVFRERSWDWYQTTLRTRLHKGGCIVLMATRWHKDDLLGRVLRESEENWTELRLPALAEPGDPLGRGQVVCPRCAGTCMEAGHDPVDEPQLDVNRCRGCNGLGLVGAALWPDMYDEASLVQRMVEAPHWFAAMYQGNPRPLAGGLFRPEHRRYYQRSGSGDSFVLDDGTIVLRNQVRVFQTVDVAASERQSADYTVVATWGWDRLRGNLLLLDLVRLHQPTPAHRGLVRSAAAKWHPEQIAIDGNTYGLALLQELRNSGLPLRSIPADRDKVTRAMQPAGYFDNRQVHLPIGAPWLREYEDELDDFPHGDHDDMVDVTSYAAQVVGDWASIQLPAELPDELRSDREEFGYGMTL